MTCSKCKQEIVSHAFSYLSNTKHGGTERWHLCYDCLCSVFLTIVNGSEDRHRAFINIMRHACQKP